MRLLKGSTSRLCNKELNRTGKFWHHESYDHYVRDEAELDRIIKYIVNNPVKAGLVNDWKDWKFTYLAKM
jgi:putative transposase